MRIECSLIIAILSGCQTGVAQTAPKPDLAQLLSNDTTRKAGVAAATASGNERLSVLLSWTRKPPPSVNKYELDIGLADVFGQMRAKEAIPFLIENISLNRWVGADPWMKTSKVIEERLPAVGALVRIGPDASKALVRAYWGPMSAKDRAAAIFTVARIRAPEARDFLSQVMMQADFERSLVVRGLKELDQGR